jgi:exodeoxyribonuclease V gamma subunit
MLYIHHSNRIERLRSLLLQHLDASAPQNVFTPEQVIVPSAALRRYLSLAVADARGICANLEFGFLAQWLWQQVARLVPGVGEDSPFAAATLSWRVHAVFGDAGIVGKHPRLQAYLGEADALMRYELACQVAALLEQYVTYRPDWLQAWHEGEAAAPASEDAAWQAATHSEDAAWQAATHSEDAAWQAATHSEDAAWQAALWRRIDGELGAPAQNPTQAFVEALRRGGAAAALPPCVHVFALPGIAPLHLRLLQPLGDRIDVHLYVLNPCQEYWFDLVDRRRLSWLSVRGRASGLEEEGNRLLAAWGTQAQVQIDSLLELCGAAAGDRLLAQLHNALLELRELEPGSVTLAEDDRSIELHVCHSLTRELEVLQDHLLGLFAADPQLRPGDVLVVTPDLDAAAPLIDAVFGTAPKDRALPYALCGARRSSLDRPAHCLLALLGLAGSRCGASDVFALLQQPPVARRFGLDDDALLQVHDWLRDAGYHWALDAAQRARFDVPATPRHTLDDALQRLFLGYALPASNPQPFDGRLGAGDAEGSSAVALGALWRYAQALQRASVSLQQPRAPEAWATMLSSLLDEFLAPADEDLDDLRELRQTIRQLVGDMRAGGSDEPLPLPVVRAALQQRLDDAAGGGAAGGSINFASMSSLRGLPFAVVCAIGLNDGAFPSAKRPLEFDLMAQHPRRGDRQRRSDERGLMLDLLLAARRSLYLSHTGRSVRDNAPLPPSVLVAELLDLLVPAIADDPASAASLARARHRLVVEHPLQAFALQAFDVAGDPRLRSHNRELAEALRGTLAAPTAAAMAPPPMPSEDDEEDSVIDAQTPFFGTPLPPPGPPWQQVLLPQLQEFFRNPCRALLRRRLGIELAHDADELQDDEPFVADARAGRALAQRLLPLLLDGADPATLPALARAGTELPEGSLGEAQLNQELQALQDFAARLREAQAEAPLPPQSLRLDVDLQGEGWQLQAAFADLRTSGLLRWRFGTARAGDYLDAWLQHLALCAAAPAGVALRTRWLHADGEFGFLPCAEAGARLVELLALYRQGLSEPLHFYPRTSWEFVERGLPAAQRAWRASDHNRFAEEADPAYRLALRGVVEPLDARFEALAMAVFGPLREHLREAAP